MRYICLYFVLGSLLMVAACKREDVPKVTKADLIEEALQKKINRWEAQIAKKCNKDVLETASHLVDSLLIANARNTREIGNRPDKPLRPTAPALKLPKDSLPVAPILPDSSRHH